MCYLVPDADEIIDTLYQVVTCDNRGLIDKISSLTGYPYQTIAGRLHGRVQGFDTKALDLLRAAFYLTRDSRLEKLLLWPGLRAAQEPTSEESGKSIEADLGDCHLALSVVHQKLREATDTNSEGGSRITPNEAKDIDRAIVALESELADVRAHLKRAKTESVTREIRSISK